MPTVNAKRVVIFGDSLSTGAGSPGTEMAAVLEAHGATVQINSRIGRSANNFYGREDVAAQLAQIAAFKPDMAIVQLGTNDLGLNLAIDGARMVSIRDALAKAGAGSEVWAFGPPAFHARMELDEQSAQIITMMVSVFGSRFIDLRRMTRDMLTSQQGRAPDGVHFTSTGGSKLGARMAAEFMDATTNNALFWVPVLALLTYVLFR